MGTLLWVLMGCAFASAAQHSPSHVAKIRFIFDDAELPISHYEIDLEATGKAHYESLSKPDADGHSDKLTRDFSLPPAKVAQIFNLAKEANYFHGSFDYTEHRVAFTGTKTISYADDSHQETASFNWSENKPITEIATIFQGISTTLEKEPVLKRLSRFDKLGLNAELAVMERQAEGGWLQELGLISDTLEEISKDPSIMTLARKRASHLLQLAAGHP